jgi:protein-disulfide isomerase
VSDTCLRFRYPGLRGGSQLGFFSFEVVMFQRTRAVLDIVSTLLVVALAGAVFWKTYWAAPATGAARPQIESVKGLSLPAAKPAHTRGKGDIVLVEFGDYERPFCARHAQTTAVEIKSQMIDAGAVQQVFFHFPLAIHAHAQKASEAAECAAEQGRFWEMHEQLFGATEGPTLEAPDFAGHAETIGIDVPAFLTCLQGNGAAERVRADLDEGRRLGVNSTPTFFVGRRQPDGSVELVKRINGAVPFDLFAQTIEGLRPRRGAE